MVTIAEVLAQAITLHQQGNLAQAERKYRAILRTAPRQPDAWHLLGLIEHARGDFAAAREHIGLAIELDGEQAPFHNHLGEVHRSLGNLTQAEACCRRAVHLQSDYAVGHNTLGAILSEQGRLPEAIASFRQAIALKPDLIQARDNLAAAHFDLGLRLQQQGQLAVAAEHYETAIRVKHDYAEAFHNLGTVYKIQGDLPRAIGCYERALEFHPNFAEVLNNLGNIFKTQGRIAEAEVCYEQTLRFKPEYAQAQYNRALARLADGDFAGGWPGYEWRWRCPDFPQHKLDAPQWDGSPLDGRTLLVHAEQGLGDTLQFIRYVPLAALQGGPLKVQVQKALLPLLAQSQFGGLLAKGTPPGDFDVQIPLLSLPGLFGTTLESIPDRVPYLRANPRLVEHWQGVLGTKSELRVGIAWQGSTTHRSDRFRSIPLRHFAPLAQPGVELISLQKGIGSEQLAEIAGLFAVRQLGGDIDESQGAFMDTAAIMQSLDLVVTSDTAIAHLAGALGVPVWVALPLSPDWRWLYERADSPWYPTMRLFRQESFDDWPPVFARIARQLRRLVGSSQRGEG